MAEDIELRGIFNVCSLLMEFINHGGQAVFLSVGLSVSKLKRHLFQVADLVKEAINRTTVFHV